MFPKYRRQPYANECPVMQISRKVASNMHRLGPKIQKVANELKNNTHRGWREAPPPVGRRRWRCLIIFQFIGNFWYFLGPACVCCQLLFLCDTLASIILPSVSDQKTNFYLNLQDPGGFSARGVPGGGKPPMFPKYRRQPYANECPVMQTSR